MKIHSIQSPPFSPSRFLVESSKDAYEANGHEFLTASEAQGRLKLRVRQIAASAVRHQKSVLPSAEPVLETDLVKVLEILSAAMSRGLDHPSPLSAGSYSELNTLLFSKPEKLATWEVAIMGALEATEKEVEFEDFIYLDAWFDKLLLFHRHGRCGAVLEGQEKEVAQKTTARFFAFAERDSDGSWDEGIKSETEMMIFEFVSHFARLLRTAPESEILLFLARFVSERLSARHECSLQEWLFLFSTLEHQFYLLLGAAPSSCLSGYFIFLQNTATRLGFCGALNRSLPLLEHGRGNFEPTYGVSIANLLQAALAGSLLESSGAEEGTPPLLPWAILHGQSSYSSISPKQMEGASRALAEAALTVVERNWVDELETQLSRITASLQWVHYRREDASWLEGVSEKTARNLAEGLEALQNNTRLTWDLLALLDHACLADLFFANPRHAAIYLRRWFVYTIGIPQIGSGWQNIKTIVASLKTAVKQAESDSPLFAKLTTAIAHLGLAQQWIDDCRRLLDAWPYATTHSLELSKTVNDEDRQSALIWSFRKVLLGFLRVGQNGAVGQGLAWISQNIAPFSELATLQANEDGYGSLAEAVREHGTLGKSSFTALSDQLAEHAGEAFRGNLFWRQSDLIGKSAADLIYKALPEYAERSGESSLALCARDSAMIIRRAALSLHPSIADRHDFVAYWWNNVVGLYLATRSPRLFQTQLIALTQATSDHLGADAGQLLYSVLEPVLSVASDDSLGEAGAVFRFEVLPPTGQMLQNPLLKSIPASPVGLHLQKWMLEELPRPFEKIAKQYPDFDKGKITKLISTLGTGIVEFASAGTFASTTVALLKLTTHGKLTGATFVNLSRSALALTDDLEELEEGLVSISFFTAWNEWSLRLNAADDLERVSFSVEEKIAVSRQGTALEVTSKDVGTLLRSLGDIWRQHSDDGCALHARRLFIQHYLARFQPEAGAMDTLISQIESSLPEDLAVWSRTFILTQLGGLRGLEAHLALLNPISKRINESADPVFSSDLVADFQWRDSINLLLAHASFDASSSVLENAGELMVNSLPLPRDEFTEKLDAVLTVFGEWFIDLDLHPVRMAAQSIQTALHADNQLDEIIKALPSTAPKVRDLLSLKDDNDASRVLLAVSEKALKPASNIIQGWNLIPGVFRSLALDSASKSGVVGNKAKFERAILNLLGTRVGQPDVIKSAIDDFAALLGAENELTRLWKLTSELDRGHKSLSANEITLTFCARSLLFAAHALPPKDSSMSLRLIKLGTGVTGSKEFEELEELARKLAEKLDGQSEASSAWKLTTKDFLKQIKSAKTL